MVLLSFLKVVIGFLFLVKGADFFVDGASSVAKKMRIPAFVIGLTIVAFGTSAPELAVSMSAALKGSNDIAIGNVVGSNIFNTLVVLGASAAITPIIVDKGMLKKDYPLSILAAILLGILSFDTIILKSDSMTLGRIDGVILLIAFAFFMFTTVRAGMNNRTEMEDSQETEKNISMIKSILLLIVGLAGIVIGGDVTVEGAKEVARFFGMSEALIGLTIVAIGTSLPELVTSIVAARKGESEIAVGNVIGSNIFNVFFILGTSATILPMNVSGTYLYDIGMLIAVMIFSYIPIAITKKVSRGMGIGMVAVYVAYTAYLIMR